MFLRAVLLQHLTQVRSSQGVRARTMRLFDLHFTFSKPLIYFSLSQVQPRAWGLGVGGAPKTLLLKHKGFYGKWSNRN